MNSITKVRKPVLECRFYRTAKGHEPVRDWLKALPANVRKEIGSDVGQVQWRWPIGKPLVDGFGHGLFEVRTALDGNIYRIVFCIRDATMLLLHGFQKKGRKTSKAVLDVAKQRQKEAEWPR